MSTPPPNELRLFTERAEDEDSIQVWLDGEVIETYTYDELGSAGLRAIEKLIERIASEL